MLGTFIFAFYPALNPSFDIFEFLPFIAGSYGSFNEGSFTIFRHFIPMTDTLRRKWTFFSQLNTLHTCTDCETSCKDRIEALVGWLRLTEQHCRPPYMSRDLELSLCVAQFRILPTECICVPYNFHSKHKFFCQTIKGLVFLMQISFFCERFG
jgi:hypothetical protein